MDFKSIKTVPTATHLIDIVLSNTQKKTPTVIKKHAHISKIRKFYTSKVTFLMNEYVGKLTEIIENFPKLDDIHPFFRDLINILYDRDTYKMCLGHISGVKKSIENTGKEYIRLIKYGESLYQCKQLKIAAFGKMCSSVKKLNLEYLEEVRQHMSRLPLIQMTRTLLIVGYPNVGKSSYMKSITKAKVDIQSYPFTTRSLYVGHFEYRDLNWQVIDTPGILDRNIDEMNTIEMQSVTALAHIPSVILFFIDTSHTCGYSITDQINLYHNLKPLLQNKTVIVLSKSDISEFDLNLEYEADSENQQLKEFLKDKCTISISTKEQNNIEILKNLACDMIIEEDYQNNKEMAAKIVNPEKMPEKEPEMLRKEKIITEKEKMVNDPLYEFDNKKHYFVKNEWKYDNIPEFCNGANVCDILNTTYEIPEITVSEYDILSKNEKEMIDLVWKKRKERMIIGKMNKRKSLPEGIKKRAQKNKDKDMNMYEDIEFKEKKENNNLMVRKQFKGDKIYVKPKEYNKRPKHLYR